MRTIQLDIVSAERSLYSGTVQSVFATLLLGEVGIFPGHTPLLSPLKPGTITIRDTENKEQCFYISGGILEVQPFLVTILANTVIRADNLDEAAALEAQKNAKKRLNQSQTRLDYSTALAELAASSAQIRIINERSKR